MDTRNDPIEFSHEDQLGRASTAKVFAKALLANPRRPMIVAVFGPWGSGKTSFANLLSADLRASGAQCAWFNPWQFTNVEAMTLAFFDLLATSVGMHKDSEYATTRECFYRYAEAVTSMALVSSPSAKTAKRTFRLTSDAHGLLSQPALSNQRDLLVRIFAGSPKPIIIFIDDIDRLFATEIRLLIQLVKSNADFPNLKFVLLFQKETVEAALKTDGQTGADFLEKIIEVPIELPLIRGAQYVNDLLREVADIFGDLAELSARDNDRWQYLLQRGILKKFTTLRQKNRLIDRLHLHKWNIENSLGLDVNLVDLLALEILRAIDYDLYAAIRRHGHSLTEAGETVRSLHYQDDGAAYLADVLAEAGPGDHELGKAIILDLFPCFGAARLSSAPRDDERAYRICRIRHFPKYFFEGLLPEEMSRAGRRRLELAALKGEQLYELLVAFHERKLLGDALEYLRSMAAQIPSEHWKQVACDLGRIVDQFGKRREKGFDRSVVKEAEGVVVEMIESGSPRERMRILRSLVLETHSVQLAISLIDVLTRDLGWFTHEEVRRLKPRLVRGIAAAASDGRLEAFEQYGRLLVLWNEWGGRQAESFVRGLSGDPKRFTLFARSVAPYTRFETGIAQTVQTRYQASALGVLDFLPRRSALKAAVAALKAQAGQKDETFLKNLVAELKQPVPDFAVVETAGDEALRR